ncbi:GNAT family N-acetyltransferase [uncultured Methanobrevibacter sp.]|uniref:GNAT family N-acetyltransferase n=1 Tax=uncultured Methanobrevibacter sp. TaxID=253161 RepID=UPI0025DEC53B|nr:GNAT family N-acetyltransferase [uncultured Methanobrevibacter sp.]
MTEDISEIKYDIIKLTKDHDLSYFHCGLDDMDDFLKDDALKQQEDNLNTTYLLIYKNKIIGFFSLLADRISIKDIPEDYNCKYEYFPAIKIGRLAIDQNYQNNGLGTRILDNICSEIKDLSLKIGVKFITIDAYCKVKEFYYKNAFQHIKIERPDKLKRTAKRNNKTTITLYKDLKRI